MKSLIFWTLHPRVEEMRKRRIEALLRYSVKSELSWKMSLSVIRGQNPQLARWVLTARDP
jgi:hypothetical protein